MKEQLGYIESLEIVVPETLLAVIAMDTFD